MRGVGDTAPGARMRVVRLIGAGLIGVVGPWLFMYTVLAWNGIFAVAQLATEPVHELVQSPVHWNQWVITRTHGGASTYRANHLLIEDPRWENEQDRPYQTYSAGTVFLKQHWSSPLVTQQPAEMITRMERGVRGYGPLHDPWRYRRERGDGAIEFEGFADDPRVWKQCAECHGNASRRDFIFSQR